MKTSLESSGDRKVDKENSWPEITVECWVDYQREEGPEQQNYASRNNYAIERTVVMYLQLATCNL